MTWVRELIDAEDARRRYCAAGHEAKDGEHWIVKSLLPAHIAIKPCTAARGEQQGAPDAD